MLSNDFIRDLNEKNPLGSGGHLAAAYAELLKEMWSGEEP
jgi:ubiquitin carboxyl-terminal hydrolase 4/11/15